MIIFILHFKFYCIFSQVVFFDIMGLMTVVYPYRMGRVLNITMVIIILLSVWLGTGSNGDKGIKK